jgi:hypothetical protein
MSSFGVKVRSADQGRRHLIRRTVSADGAAVSLSSIKPCLVQDLSPAGARLSGRSLPPVGSELLLRTDNVIALARVQWSEGSERGVAFDEGGPSAGQCLAMQLKTRVS